MKKISIALALCAISYCAHAQNTFPTSGFAGINTTSPATDLQINHFANYSNYSGMFPGFKMTGFTTVPNSYQTFNYQHNLFEIWSSNDVFDMAPHSNNLIFFVQHDGANAGSVGINKSSASHTLDVGGNIHSDRSIYADINVEANNDVVAKHDANITHDANIKHDAIVDNDLTVWQKTRLDKDVYIGGFTTIHSLMNNGAGDIFVTADLNGKLDVEHLPTFSLSGGILKLSNGLSWNTSISLPGDDLGNHKATTTLNMNSNPIVGATTITCSGNLNSGPINSSGNIVAHGLNVGLGSVGCGHLTCSDANCLGNMHVGIDFDVTGHAKVGGNLKVTGNAITGNLTVNGTANCTTQSWGSDKRFKKNISDITSLTDKLFQIKSYSYNFRKDEFEGKKQFDDRLHYGFIAQEVEEIFPDLAVKNEDGYYGVNYVEFIPLLLQSLKEEHEQVKQLQAVSEDKTQQLSTLENKVTELESKLNELSNCCTGRTATNANNTNNTISVGSTLDQNNPNPFSKESVIGFHIVGEYAKAFIGVYDLNGKELNRLNIDGRSNKVTVSNLQPGMYVYSLIVDGVLIDSKKMVVLGE